MLSEKIGNRYLLVKTGFANINNVDAVLKKLSVLQKTSIFQILLIKPIASAEQILFAAEQAIDSFERKSNFSKNPSLEFLLRLTGKRQINKALEIAALRQGKNAVAIVALGSNRKSAGEAIADIEKEIGFKGEKDIIEKNAKENIGYLKEIYNISDSRLEALKDAKNPLKEAVLERIAMLSLEE